MNNSIVKNVFKDGNESTTKEKYIQLMIKIIQTSEKNKFKNFGDKR